ncbi:hypothetical protein HDR59_01235 [bacterium]|nr:hypothetical protein [bacterium]
MKKIVLVLLLLCIGVKCFASDDLYTMVKFESVGFAVRGESDTLIGCISTITDNNKKTETYSLENCLEKMHYELEESSKYTPFFNYINNGVWDSEGSYVRFACIKLKDIESYISQKSFCNVDYDKFFNKYEDKLPKELKEEDFDKYTILPFEKDEKLAREYSDKLNTLMNTTYKTSFDCSLENLSDRENLICHNKELADKDIELNSLYKKVVSKYKGTEDLQKIKSSQQKWVREYLIHVDDILDSYKDRIKYLKCLIEKDFNECKRFL